MTMPHGARNAAPFLLLAALLLPSAALAVPSAAEKAEAEVLFQDAKKLMLQKRWPDACRKLEASQRLDPAGGTLFNLALCHEGEGKLATAWVEFGDALAQAKIDKKTERIKLSQEHIDKLDHRLPRLVVRLEGPAPRGLQVYRDEVELREASFGSAIPVDPGEHLVRATAPKFLPYEERFSLAEGQTKTLVLPALTAEPEPPPAVSSSAPPPPPPPPLPPSKRKTIGLVVGGVGVASLAVGAFFGFRTLAKKSDSDSECPTATTCSSKGVQANNDAHSAANIANIGLGLGLVGLGVGTYLFLTSPPSNPPPAAAFRVTPSLSGDGGGLLVHGRF